MRNARIKRVKDKGVKIQIITSSRLARPKKEAY